VPLPRTRSALEIYDAGKSERHAVWDAVETNEDVWACVARDKEAADLVREAFAEDTAHVNSRDRAFLIHPDDPWVRRLASANT
jgi:hypothetical protein